MTKWEETNNNSKVQLQYQQFLEKAHIAWKRYIKAKGNTKERINKIVAAD